jgi:hypothetical protein
MAGRGRLQLEGTGDKEEAVADRLELEPARGRAPIEGVVGILFQGGGLGTAVETVGAAEHDRTDEPFHRPAVFNEADGEVVEQLGMARLASGRAEVVDRLDEAPSEEVLPDPVRHDPRGERMGR